MVHGDNRYDYTVLRSCDSRVQAFVRVILYYLDIDSQSQRPRRTTKAVANFPVGQPLNPIKYVFSCPFSVHMTVSGAVLSTLMSS